MPNPWWVAARLHTLPAAAVPVLVAAGLATGEGAFRFTLFLATLVGALAIQVAANFANDASDAARGVDSNERVGPPRMVAAGLISSRAMWQATWLCIAIAAGVAAYLTSVVGPIILLIGLISVVAMLSYVGGPVAYGYRGFGELAVFVFFGLVATVGSRYVYDRTVPQAAWILAIPIGLLATAILVANNLRDLDTDANAGKRTLAVMIGRRRTRFLYLFLMIGAFGAIATAALLGRTPALTGIAVGWMPLSVPLIETVMKNDDPNALISVLKGTARLQLLVGLSLAAGAAV